MPDLDDEELLSEAKEAIKSLVKAESQRLALSPSGTDLDEMVRIQILYVKERLEQLADEFDGEGARGAAAIVRALVEGWLPELAKELQSQE